MKPKGAHTSIQPPRVAQIDCYGGAKGSRIRLQTKNKALKSVHEKTERVSKGNLRILRQSLHKAPRLETVLQQQMQVERLVKAAPKDRSRAVQRLQLWRWTMSDLQILKLPSFSFGSPNCCAYCGNKADCRDHVIAVSYQSNSKKHRFSGNGPWVWSCNDCNENLSNRYFDTFGDRCEWNQWRLTAKVKPVEWHTWELKPMDYNLRSHIRAEMEQRKQWQSRADFYGSREFYLNLESLIWEVAQLRDSLGAKFLRAYFSDMLRAVADLYKPNR